MTNDDQGFEECKEAVPKWYAKPTDMSSEGSNGIRTDNAAAPTWITVFVLTHIYGKPRPE